MVAAGRSHQRIEPPLRSKRVRDSPGAAAPHVLGLLLRLRDRGLLLLLLLLHRLLLGLLLHGLWLCLRRSLLVVVIVVVPQPTRARPAAPTPARALARSSERRDMRFRFIRDQ